MLKNYSDLNALARDALQEIGNIGTGNALTALSSMIHQTIHLQTPAVRIVPYQDAQELLGGAQTVKVGILIETSGDMNGIFMFLLNETFTRQLLEGVLGKSTIDLREPDEMSQSAICEIGNHVLFLYKCHCFYDRHADTCIGSILMHRHGRLLAKCTNDTFCTNGR